MPGKDSDSEYQLGDVANVVIDRGTFKYMLCRVSYAHENEQGSSKVIVRGATQSESHADIFNGVESSLRDEGFACHSVGGGLITHDASAKTIWIYGHSEHYGRADHSVTVDLLKKKYPNYDEICISDEQS